MPAVEPVLQIRGLRTCFHSDNGIGLAVEGVSFDLWRGETLGLVGESGCGKTTLGRLVLRLLDATSGEVYFMGLNLHAMGRAEPRALRPRRQIIFQDPYGSLNPRLRVGSIVGEGLKILRGRSTRTRPTHTRGRFWRRHLCPIRGHAGESCCPETCPIRRWCPVVVRFTRGVQSGEMFVHACCPN